MVGAVFVVFEVAVGVVVAVVVAVAVDVAGCVVVHVVIDVAESVLPCSLSALFLPYSSMSALLALSS